MLKRGENLEEEMIAVNLLRVLKQISVNSGRGDHVDEWFPKFDIDGEWVTVTEIYVRSLS